MPSSNLSFLIWEESFPFIKVSLIDLLLPDDLVGDNGGNKDLLDVIELRFLDDTGTDKFIIFCFPMKFCCDRGDAWLTKLDDAAKLLLL